MRRKNWRVKYRGQVTCTLAGGGIDLGISERIAFRVFQVDYLRVGTDQGSNNFRIAGGPVFRF